MHVSSRAGRQPDETGIFKVLVIVVIIALAIVAAAYLFRQSKNTEAFQLTPTIQPKYIADVQLIDQTQPQQSYNDLIILKDALVVTAAGVGLTACTDLTFGACAAAAGGVASFLDITNDTILTTSTTFTFKNTGNGTAINWSYQVVTIINNQSSASQTFSIPPLAPNQNFTSNYSQATKFGSIPTLIWNTITQHTAKVTFAVYVLQGQSAEPESVSSSSKSS
jgi:hypothetical protein